MPGFPLALASYNLSGHTPFNYNLHKRPVANLCQPFNSHPLASYNPHKRSAGQQEDNIHQTTLKLTPPHSLSAHTP